MKTPKLEIPTAPVHPEAKPHNPVARTGPSATAMDVGGVVATAMDSDGVDLGLGAPVGSGARSVSFSPSMTVDEFREVIDCIAKHPDRQFVFEDANLRISGTLEGVRLAWVDGAKEDAIITIAGHSVEPHRKSEADLQSQVVNLLLTSWDAKGPKMFNQEVDSDVATTSGDLPRKGKTEVTLAQARADLKVLGYQLKTKAGSMFTSGTVIHKESGVAVNGGNVLEAPFYAAHKAFFEYQQSHSIKDGNWRTII